MNVVSLGKFSNSKTFVIFVQFAIKITFFFYLQNGFKSSNLDSNFREHEILYSNSLQQDFSQQYNIRYRLVFQPALSGVMVASVHFDIGNE